MGSVTLISTVFGILAVFLQNVHFSCQVRSTPESTAYVAAVVEYYPTFVGQKDSPLKAPEININNYIKFIQKAKDYNVDIIVFPEGGLWPLKTFDVNVRDKVKSTYVPDPKDNITTCNNSSDVYNEVLAKISCAAIRFGMYVVLNHLEKVDCPTPNCATDNFLYYNTNVVFDRKGKVIARYRKFNLVNDPNLNVTDEPKISTFETDFGVTFGLLTSFDILFEYPALNYVNNLKITDIILPNRWFHELPFLVSTSVQAAWAYATDVNLLASGYNYPTSRSSGSGIYAGTEGFVETFLSSERSMMLIVGQVPKVINGIRGILELSKTAVYDFGFKERNEMMDGMVRPWHYEVEDLKLYTTELVDVSRRVDEQTLCNNELCCHFKLKTTFNESLILDNGIPAVNYKYRLAAFSGTRQVRLANRSKEYAAGVDNCAILTCMDEELNSCARKFSTNISYRKPLTFESISITMNVTVQSNSLIMPIITLTDMTPLSADKFIYYSSNATLVLLNPRNDLMTFALYRRNFTADKIDINSAHFDKFTNPSYIADRARIPRNSSSSLIAYMLLAVLLSLCAIFIK